MKRVEAAVKDGSRFLQRATGTFRRGQVELDAPVNWQEGQRVSVMPQEEALGLAEAEWSDTAEALAEWFARFDAIEPLEFKPEEQAEIAAARAAVRQASIQAVRRKMEL